MSTALASASSFVPDVVTSWRIEFSPESQTPIQVHQGQVSGELAHAPDRSCTVFFDGVIFNRSALGSDLRVEPGALGDAELLLRLYLHRGEDFVRSLNGTYALVVWDGQTDTLMCVRDRMGLHPLFYADTTGGLLLSDSIETLLRDPRVSGELNRRLLALHVWPAWWIEEKDETYFRAVRRVVAGTVLRVRHQRRESYRYWSPAPPGGEVDWVEDGAMEQFEATLAEAVARPLRRGPAAICLSGGLDSISIASFAAELTAQDGMPTPMALSVEFPDPDNLGEASVQKRVASRLGMPQIMMTLDEALGHGGLLPAALELSRSWPVPLLGIFSPAYFTLIEQAKQEGCEVVMTGSGGDNWLSVALEYSADLIARGDFVGLMRLWYTYQRSYRTPRSLLLRRILWKYGLRNVLISTEQRLLRRLAPPALYAQTRLQVEKSLPAWLAPDKELRDEIVELTTARKAELKPRPGDFYVNEIRRGLDHPILAVELEEAFEKGRRLGVEILMPYYDADIVDLLCRVPPRVLTMGDRSKSLVRQSMARRLSDLGIERQKKVTTGNFWPQKLEEATGSWDSYGGPRTLGELGVVDAKVLDEEVTGMLAANKQSYVPYVWEILDHEAWVRARL